MDNTTDSINSNPKKFDSFNIKVEFEVGHCDIDTDMILLSALQKSYMGWEKTVILNTWSYVYTPKNEVELQLTSTRWDGKDDAYRVIYNKKREELDELDYEENVFKFVEDAIKKITHYSYRSIFSMDVRQKTDIKIISITKV